MSEVHTGAKDCQPVRIALIGCGAVSQLYYTPALQELSRIGRARVSAVFDPQTEHAAKLLASFPSACRVKAVSELSARVIDLAVVASPNCFHAEQTIELVNAGISVLCEKPMAVSVAQATKMIDEAEASGKLLAVGLVRRFLPALKFVRKFLASGLLGSVSTFHFTEGGTFAWNLQSGSLFNDDTAGGGLLIDVGTHVIDLMTWWFGEPEELIYEDDAIGGLEANCLLTAKFKSGLTGSIRLSRDWPILNRYFIACEKGWISWTVGKANEIEMSFDQTDLALSARIHQLLPDSDEAGIGAASFTYQQSFMAQLLNVFAAISNNETLVVSGQEALSSVRTIERCYKNRKLMRIPWLSDREMVKAESLSTCRQLC